MSMGSGLVVIAIEFGDIGEILGSARNPLHCRKPGSRNDDAVDQRVELGD
ncbi:MAG TPA: hypothetical protein VH143_06935 [Kofleriaceae bacterium]|jgi:hypothetical protein|nr:hypothetical protein [Kofleriaceae bacterium]